MNSPSSRFFYGYWYCFPTEVTQGLSLRCGVDRVARGMPFGAVTLCVNPVHGVLFYFYFLLLLVNRTIVSLFVEWF